MLKKKDLLFSSDKVVQLLPIHYYTETQANELLQKWGLAEKWKFAWNSEEKVLGRCHYRERTIALSRYYCLWLSEQENLDTILHEIAHALTYEQYFIDIKLVPPNTNFKQMIKDYCNGHGVIWEVFCKKVGAKPKACYDGMITVPNGKNIQ